MTNLAWDSFLWSLQMQDEDLEWDSARITEILVTAPQQLP